MSAHIRQDFKVLVHLNYKKSQADIFKFYLLRFWDSSLRFLPPLQYSWDKQNFFGDARAKTFNRDISFQKLCPGCPDRPPEKNDSTCCLCKCLDTMLNLQSCSCGCVHNALFTLRQTKLQHGQLHCRWVIVEVLLEHSLTQLYRLGLMCVPGT